MEEIEDMINNIVNQDFSKSQTYFDVAMQGKVNDSLEQEKIAMANRIFNLDNPEGENFEEPLEASEEEQEADVSEDELEAGAEEALDDEEFTEYEFGSNEEDEEEDFSDDEE